jgi:D-beta-D-heptose 7-phosphate kinase/D-beta-D-heptose 1-phosphate adenosyltransferase
MSKRSAIESKILSPSRLLSALKKVPSRKTVVFTNGCFDILHAGHVTYLDRARRLGDLLIVAVNSDASTARLKGPTRPVNPLEDRLKVLAALESVSFVTWFEEDTPRELIAKVLPDVLVKGGDYRVKDIVGYDEVKANGGKTKVLPFLEGRSTTDILKRLE